AGAVAIVDRKYRGGIGEALLAPAGTAEHAGHVRRTHTRIGRRRSGRGRSVRRLLLLLRLGHPVLGEFLRLRGGLLRLFAEAHGPTVRPLDTLDTPYL